MRPADLLDLVGFASLAMLVSVFGLARRGAVMPLWIRMRQQVVLIWLAPCLRRGADLAGLRNVSAALHQASAVVCALVACSVLPFVWREVRRGFRPG